MRRLHMALEGHYEPTNYGELSLEEEQLMESEANAEAAAANSDLAEADRMADMSDALEDLAVIADGIEEPTVQESQLVDTVAQMAVAGTDLPAEAVVPPMEAAMEDFKSKKIAMESVVARIKETAAKIWAEIKRIVKKVWDNVESFFYKIFGTIPGLRKRLKALRDRADSNTGVVDAKKITVTGGVAAVSVNYKTPSNAGDLKKGAEALLKEGEFIYDKAPDAALKMGEVITKALEDFDTANPIASAATVRKGAAVFMKAVNGVGMSGGSTNRWEGFSATMSEPLPGNVSVAVRVPKGAHGTADQNVSPSVSSLDGDRRIVIEMVPTSEKSKDAASSFEMSTMSNSEIISLTEQCEKILDMLEKFQRGKRFNELKAMRKKLESASDKAAKAVEKLDGKEEGNEKVAIPYYRAILGFNTAFAKWSKDPAMPMIHVNLAFIRSAMVCCEKSLSAHKAK